MESKQGRLKALQCKKEALFQRLQVLYDKSKQVKDPKLLKEFSIRYLTLQETKSDFTQVVEEINLLSLELDATFTPNYQELNVFDELYCRIKSVAQSVLKEEHSQTVASQRTEATPRLPKINLVEFNGDPVKWPLFYQTFKSLIHDNSALDSVSKVHYLLGTLSGKALSITAGILPTADNYDLLWNALQEKYEDKRTLANTYLSQILEFKPLQTDSVQSLNAFIEKVDGAVNALQKINLENLSDFVLMTISLSKLDSQTQRLFERSLQKGVIPSYAELSVFVKEQAKIVARTSVSTNVKQNASSNSNVHKSFNKVHAFSTKECSYKGGTNKSEKFSCQMCKNSEHRLYQCAKFLDLPAIQRVKFVNENRLCFNCLLPGHIVTVCTSTGLCYKCKRRHHSVLHINNSFSKSPDNNVIKQDSSSTVSSDNDEGKAAIASSSVVLCSAVAKELEQNYTSLLATVVVQVVSSTGVKHYMRFLIDSASQSHFITYKWCQILKLPISKSCTMVCGIGASEKRVRGYTQITFSSRFDNTVKYQLQALVLDKITDALPNCSLNSEVYKEFEHLPLADELFDKPGKIDGIIGVELVPHLLLGTSKHREPNFPVAINSPLGYIIMGKAPIGKVTPDNQRSSISCLNSVLHIESLLGRFWELEQVPVVHRASAEDIECERLYKSSTFRRSTGRYVVSLPFKVYPPNLAESYETAARRFHNLEKRFSKDVTYKKDYCIAIQDYIDKGHMSPTKDVSLSDGFFIPHHGVVKPSSFSTPLRVVFDASAKSSSGLSLNDVLYTGPKLQKDIFHILINFRLLEVAMIADVRQMYRQIDLCEEHHKYQKLLWRSSEEEAVQIYELTTVSFGISSSPYLALRTVHQLASDECERFPQASEVVFRDIYMDDLISSVENDVLAEELHCQLSGLFKSGGFELVKWATNSSEFSSKIPEDIRANKMFEFPDEFLAVLGLQWFPKDDTFHFYCRMDDKKCSKRNILSTVARIWDPLGLLAPVTIYAKLLIKELWILKLDWDDPTPPSVSKVWQEFCDTLQELSCIRIPRHIGFLKNSYVTLIGFCDASEKAYAACVYIRVVCNDNVSVSLLCGKSKVAPIKVQSIPRLELCGALLLAQLIRSVVDIYSSRCTIDKMYALSDSEVVLNWINSSPHRWTCFVANRVSKIQTLVDSSLWYHVRGSENPSDCASRGLNPREFVNHPSWLYGPSWSHVDESQWPIRRFEAKEGEVSLESKTVTLVVSEQRVNPLYLEIQRCSSWTKLLHVVVYVLKFCRKLPRSKTVSANDLIQAEITLIRIVQEVHFSEEINLLEKGNLPSKRLLPLHPFVQDGILRVGGRLTNAKDLSFEQKHPVLLPKHDHFTELVVDHFHRKNLHTGPHLLLSLLRQKYWILSARSLVRQRVLKCNHCFRFKPRSCVPLMADLPAPRVNQAKAFLHAGVDYGGPYFITLSRHRGVKAQKAYICLFICLATHAVHLELVSSLSTEAFLAALKRFLARRGPCVKIYSDCGTNFVGAKGVLDEVKKFASSKPFNDAVYEELTQQFVQWKFNPPSAPHFGGIWEANMKCVKTHLTKVIGEQILSYEEFLTVLTQVEALLNSRPLCWLSSDPSEPVALTPAHFLTLMPLNSFPTKDFADTPMNRLSRWELLDKIVQSFWKRWRVEYLHSLQSRQKWNSPKFPVKPGLLVVVCNDNTPSFQWPLGVIQDIFPGKDGVVRVATVKTKGGVFKRPVVKLCPLPSQ